MPTTEFFEPLATTSLAPRNGVGVTKWLHLYEIPRLPRSSGSSIGNSSYAT
jgi:hypothetical protein